MLCQFKPHPVFCCTLGWNATYNHLVIFWLLLCFVDTSVNFVLNGNTTQNHECLFFFFQTMRKVWMVHSRAEQNVLKSSQHQEQLKTAVMWVIHCEDPNGGKLCPLYALITSGDWGWSVWTFSVTFCPLPHKGKKRPCLDAMCAAFEWCCPDLRHILLKQIHILFKLDQNGVSWKH